MNKLSIYALFLIILVFNVSALYDRDVYYVVNGGGNNNTGGNFVEKTGDTMSGNLNMSDNDLVDVDTLYVHNISGRSPINIIGNLIGTGFNITADNFYGNFIITDYYNKSESDARFYPLNSNPAGYINQSNLTGASVNYSAYSGQSNYSQYVNETNINGSNIIFTLLRYNTTTWNDTNTPTLEDGLCYYSDIDGNHDYNCVINAGAGVVLQLGEELYLDRLAKNGDNVTIENCMPVYVSGATGSNLVVKRASSMPYRKAQATIGLATQQIAVNDFGRITLRGAVNDCDTSAWTEGSSLFLNTTNGALTSTVPGVSETKVFMGMVTRQNANVGRISVNPVIIPSLDDISFVNATLQNNTILLYDNSSSVWQSRNLYSILTNYNDSALTTDYFKLISDPTGFRDTTTTTISMNASTLNFTITPTGTNYSYYINGTECVKTSDSVIVANTTGKHFIYYNSCGNLVQSINVWSFEGVAQVSIVYIANDSKVTVGDERHDLGMDWRTHKYLHSVFGTRYYQGLSGTFNDTGFTITAGELFDENLELPISQTSRANVYYRNPGNSWLWLFNQTQYFYKNATNMYYDNSGVLTPVPANQYMAVWIFGTNDINVPIMSMIGQRVDTTLADARANNVYENIAFGDMPFVEFKVLYRIILRNDATPFEETADYRSVSSAPSGTFVATSHSTLTGLLNDDHTQYLRTDGTRNLTGNWNVAGWNITASNFFGNVNASYIQNPYWYNASNPKNYINGTGTTNYVPYFSSSGELKSDKYLYWNDTTLRHCKGSPISFCWIYNANDTGAYLKRDFVIAGSPIMYEEATNGQLYYYMNGNYFNVDTDFVINTDTPTWTLTNNLEAVVTASANTDTGTNLQLIDNVANSPYIRYTDSGGVDGTSITWASTGLSFSQSGANYKGYSFDNNVSVTGQVKASRYTYSSGTLGYIENYGTSGTEINGAEGLVITDTGRGIFRFVDSNWWTWITHNGTTKVLSIKGGTQGAGEPVTDWLRHSSGNTTFLHNVFADSYTIRATNINATTFNEGGISLNNKYNDTRFMNTGYIPRFNGSVFRNSSIYENANGGIEINITPTETFEINTKTNGDGLYFYLNSRDINYGSNLYLTTNGTLRGQISGQAGVGLTLESTESIVFNPNQVQRLVMTSNRSTFTNNVTIPNLNVTGEIIMQNTSFIKYKFTQSTSATTFNITGLPSGYKSMIITGMLADTNSGDMWFIINGDVRSNYAWQRQTNALAMATATNTNQTILWTGASAGSQNIIHIELEAIDNVTLGVPGLFWVSGGAGSVGSAPVLWRGGLYYRNSTGTNINSLQFFHQGSQNINAGSYVEIELRK